MEGYRGKSNTAALVYKIKKVYLRRRSIHDLYCDGVIAQI
jgi:hypothetical protein